MKKIITATLFVSALGLTACMPEHAAIDPDVLNAKKETQASINNMNSSTNQAPRTPVRKADFSNKGCTAKTNKCFNLNMGDEWDSIAESFYDGCIYKSQRSQYYALKKQYCPHLRD